MYYLSQQTKKDVTDKPNVFGNISMDEYKAKMTDKSYKWILSPETQLTESELKVFTVMMVKKIEEETGLKLDWQAAVHTDTGHPHVHILFNGKDSSGNDYEFPRNFIKRDCRELCQDVLTMLKGYRTPEQIAAAKNNRPLASRYTEYDDEINSLLDDCKISTNDARLNELTRKRLDYLRSIGLAVIESGNYVLSPSWTNDLKALGKYNTYLDAKDMFDRNESYELFNQKIDQEIRGTILKFYRMDDENVWTNAVIIRGYDGKGYFVPVYNPSVFTGFKIGEDIIISSRNRNGKSYISMKQILDKDIDRIFAEYDEKIRKQKEWLIEHEDSELSDMFSRLKEKNINTSQTDIYELRNTYSREQILETGNRILEWHEKNELHAAYKKWLEENADSELFEMFNRLKEKKVMTSSADMYELLTAYSRKNLLETGNRILKWKNNDFYYSGIKTFKKFISADTEEPACQKTDILSYIDGSEKKIHYRGKNLFERFIRKNEKEHDSHDRNSDDMDMNM